MSTKEMTKEEFKVRWESNDTGGGITMDDIAKCAKEWGLCDTPKIKSLSEVLYMVVKAANTNDCEDFAPVDDDDDE